MSNELITELVEAGVHFGHQSRKWNPRMRPYILGERQNVHIINLEKTAEQLDASGAFLRDLVSKGKKILFVGCKRQAQDAVREAAEATGEYLVNHRWLGGTTAEPSDRSPQCWSDGVIGEPSEVPDFRKRK